MAGFEKIMRHMSQWDNTGRSRDDPHIKGLENVNILNGFLVAALSEIDIPFRSCYYRHDHAEYYRR